MALEESSLSQDLVAADLPITIYDRPVHAMSNLLLRGNVDAATRAIFAPNSLTPNELQTFRSKLLGPKPNSLLKTVVDIGTNPLVILGLVAGYLIYPIKGNALYNLAKGLTKAPPVGQLSSYTNSAFTNLRNLTGKVGGKQVGMFDLFSKVSDDATSFITRHRDGFAKILQETSLDEDASHAIAMRQQGLHKAGSKLQGRWKMDSSKPVMPGYQAKASGVKDMISVGDKIENQFKLVRKDLVGDPKLWEAFKENMKARGIDIGDDIDDYWPRHTVPNEIEKAFALDLKIPSEKYLKDNISSNLYARTGEAVPDIKQLRRLEDKGWVYKGFSNELEQAIEREIAEKTAMLAPSIEAAQAIVNTSTDPAAIKAAKNMLKKAIKEAFPKGGGASGRTKDVVADLLINQQGRLSIEDAGRMLSSPRQYSLALESGIERYLAGAGPTYAWHIKGTGNQIETLKRQLMNAPKSPTSITNWQIAHIDNELTPLVQGKKTWTQYSRNVAHGEWKSKKIDWIKNHAIASQIPAKQKDFIVRQLDKFDDIGVESIGNASNHYFYLSTLGGNLAPASRNLLQNVLTVAPITGMGNLMKGLGSVVERSGPYLADINSMGIKSAFKKNFPEFVKAIGDRPGIVEQMLAGDLVQTGTAASRLAHGSLRKAQGALLAPFGTSETINRLVGFYAGRAQGLAEFGGKLTGEALEAAASKVGRVVTDVAHFPGGALGMPKALMNIPAPLRQFMHFPLRYAGFLGSSLRYGAEGKLDLGTIGRTLAFSTGAYVGTKNLLGVDISAGLAAGALPLPQYESAPFFPFPLVPPGVSAIGGIVKGAVTGELRPIQEAGWMLVPAGLGIKRLNHTLGQKYADYKNPTPDGRIPVYNKDKSLIGTFTKFQLALRSIGIAPMNAEQEKAAATWLASQRDKVRAYKREYLNAMASNDSNQMDVIQRDFQKAYPELGPMKVKKSDVTALRNRREVSRLNRVLRGFPKAYKPLFGNMVAETELSSLTQNLDPVSLPQTLTQYE